MDKDPNYRSCSVPGIPYVRDWIELNFGDLCALHDEAYADGKCRVCRDIKFIGQAAARCLPFVFALIALPLVFIGFQINTGIKSIIKKVGSCNG